MPTTTDSNDTTLDRPRAFRREGLLSRIAPFAVTGFGIILLTPLVLDQVDMDPLVWAGAINVAIVALVVVVPWGRLPRWTEAIAPISSLGIIALLRDATGGGGSILNALMLLPIFWLALHGARRELLVALAVLFATLATPVYVLGPPGYPDGELVRAVLWTMVAGVIGMSVQRVVDRSWHNARRAERTAELRAEANEQLREADLLKSQFVAMVSHELRTPLTSIRGFANTILHHYHELADDDRIRFAGIIEEQAERLSRLVEDLLALSRIESGTISSRPRPLDIDVVIERAVAQVEADAEITVRCEEDLRALADADHVEQMLVNYLANARRYGAPPIVVTAARIGDSVQVVVSDSGPGVDDDFVPHLFERFTQANGHGGEGGTGLGLSIVRGLAHAEGGEAWYERGRDGGSCFAVSLPLASPGRVEGYGEEPPTHISVLDR